MSARPGRCATRWSSAAVGRTGKYAGADGTATIESLSFNERTLTAYERVTVTFTP